MAKNYQGHFIMAKKTITSSISKIVREYGNVVAQSIPVDKIIVFGSQAKGKAGDESDIDVCVVSPKFGKDWFEESLTLDRLTDNISTKIEAHPMSPRDLENKYDTLASEIRKYGIDVVL